VQTVRLPVTPKTPPQMGRAELGMPEGFCFLFVFDYRSVFKRKNPLGLVEAFCEAFEPGSGPSLVIKSICGDEFPAERAALAAAASRRPEIHLIEDMISAEEKNAMIASCDCYVSLHRSEGFGLTMAEAMYFGRPTIATAYSGNLDFMTAGNSYLVPHTMAEIGVDANPYPPDGEWAEPDLGQAAKLMREVFEDRRGAAERGRRGAADIRRTHSLQAACERIQARAAEARLQRLVGELRRPDANRRSPGLTGREQLQHLLGVGYAPPPQGASRARSLAKRLYMRLLRPYTAYQQRVNENTTAALSEIEESLDELRETIARGLTVEEAVNARLAGANEMVRLLADDAVRDRERTAKADELVWAAGAEPYMANDRLGHRAHPLLGGTIGFRTNAEELGGDGYRSFEDIFRGSEEMIRDRQRIYLDLVAGHAPVLDAGCGRGEFLDLLAERGIEARGVDLDPDMVKRCRDKGHENVEQGDLLEYLEGLPERSLGTIFSAQVIEHLGYEKLQRLLELAKSRLQPGGLLIAETVNPHSAAALKAFWVDPTHAHPLFPETMLALCAQAGYSSGDVFAPVGSGDWENDRTRVGEYAVVATVPSKDS
jgi:SAM-dependent methyltransferase